MDHTICIEADYNALSVKAAADFFEMIPKTGKTLICPASGDSPTGLYREIVGHTLATGMNIADWRFVGLDEWVGMDGDDEGSCRNYLNKQLFYPLSIPDTHICFFEGKSTNLKAECEKTDAYINTNGGIDIAIVGLGMNGHIGFNEPGVSPLLRSHIIDLQTTTKQVGQKYFNNQKELSKGISIGLATLMEADHIILIVSGQHKAPIVQKMLREPISAELPGSLLLTHSSLHIYLDKAAATLLQD
jgi:galactosamine-6-phosphate isomerase